MIPVALNLQLLIHFLLIRCLDAKFVADTNYPDGSVITYGKAFTKGWIIANVGTKTWRNVQLVHQSGFLPIQPEVDVPDLAPGQQVIAHAVLFFYYSFFF